MRQTFVPCVSSTSENGRPCWTLRFSTWCQQGSIPTTFTFSTDTSADLTVICMLVDREMYWTEGQCSSACSKSSGVNWMILQEACFCRPVCGQVAPM